MYWQHAFIEKVIMTKIVPIVLFVGCFLQIVVHGAERGVTLEEKVRNLQESMLKRPLINLNLEKWKTYVQSSPRNYSMIVMFTVLSQSMNCPICKPAYDEYLILANSYRYTFLNTKALYFALVDYEEAPQIFSLLNLNTAPAIYHFPPKGARRTQDTMDFQRMGIDADAMAKFVQDRTDVQIRVLRPPNYAAPVVVLLLVMLVLGLLYMRRNNLEFLFNRTFWALVCSAIVFAFMSGQMWNHIRGPPFVMTNPQTRETSLIHGSTQYQLIAETYIVLALYAAVTVGVVVLHDAASGKTEPGKRKLMACIGIGMVVVFFSLLLSVFRSKYHGYPYHFLFS
uniref:Magnesium transporter protein 1 n=1 Tax=Globodera pallida TaxID=36090 RepID=A0A183CFZ3_GLOPA